MCDICEHYEIGDILPYTEHNGECPECGNRFTVQMNNPQWVDDLPHSKNGSLLHITWTGEPYVCMKCGSVMLLGFYCQGINGGKLFETKLEEVDEEKASRLEHS
jgi:hypothetical protein